MIGVKLLEEILECPEGCLDECEIDCLQVSGNLRFTRNFGPYVVGQCVQCIAINFCEGWMREYDEMDKLVREIQIGLGVVMR